MEMKFSQQIEGCHEGILAGMPEQEREKAVEAAVKDALFANSGLTPLAILKSTLTAGSPTRDFEALLASEYKETLKNWARIYKTGAGSNAKKAELAESLAAVLPTLPALHEAVLRVDLSPSELAAFRALLDAGGMMQVPEDGLTSIVGLPRAMSMLCYAFYEKGARKGEGVFTFVVPDQMMDVLSGLDWDDMEQYALERELVLDIAGALTELRGIVDVEGAYNEYVRHSKHPFDLIEFEDINFYAIKDGSSDNAWLETEDGPAYLVNYMLAQTYQDGMGLPADDGMVLYGPLGPLEYFVDSQTGKLARPLEEGTLSEIDVFNWKCSLPAARALRGYLDAHVPDDQDDYFFADSVMDELVDFMSLGVGDAITVRTYFEILEDHGFIPDAVHMKCVLNLLMNMANAMPCWPNNGWSPNELAEQTTGRKTFYNGDGSMMKVGRNDPCPCGSGKKYKHCCGKSGWTVVHGS